MSVRYKEIGNKCYELLRGCSLPVFSLMHGINYTGKKNLGFVLKDDGRFEKINVHNVAVWKIKGCC